MASVHLILVPWDSARLDWRMGRGPRVLAPLVTKRLEQDGHSVRETTIDATEPTAEIRTAFELASGIAGSVRAAVGRGESPIVLAGNCISSLGTISAIAHKDLALVWHDAHGDLNTPETSTSGFLDGMALAACTGRCWNPMTATIPGFMPVRETRVHLAGARDLDPAEEAVLSEGRISHGADPTRALRGASGFYAHVDLDVLDPERVGPANVFATPGGVLADDVVAVIRNATAHAPLRALAITAYDPAVDHSGKVAAAAVEIVAALTQ
jgi:arginase